MTSRNKQKEFYEDIITDCIEDLDLYDAGFRNPMLDDKRRQEMLSNMADTALKVYSACLKLKKVIKGDK